ncbi:Pet117 cytochrome c oxidase assembly protein [Schizosaccharomyces japonicus yFS275]|uniref:Pet117 cytochrome c oxidase assembly protein n=1 Tax=Schizosaccharomyces japonicus (strain yFS275 / FY16936) TaxID=402676 RepID=B6JWS6_SCHJY|nr:Pet117 cytochrome c oxidase assembly protein [Schizosaccharomyces japonicus yFS275]EEB05827.1 Pet117 cytochrome c oxidase assembly protein [Schizosaccharomyces japonicus yFS275]
MSTASKVSIGLASLFCVGMIAFVHQSQGSEKQNMQLGIEKDRERKQRRQERINDFNRQKQLYSTYVVDQPVQAQPISAPPDDLDENKAA